ncbi:MAG: hypothetical protein M1609_13125 [Firmicutes bacterium]|nr:hypothetical protein [Bacillota bacterium]
MAGNWDIRRVYLYLVSFTTLMMMVFGTVMFFQGVVNLVYPNPQNSYETKFSRPVPAEKGGGGLQLTDAEIKQQAKQEQAQARYYQIKQMIDSLMLLIVALPVYLYHWKKIQRSDRPDGVR